MKKILTLLLIGVIFLNSTKASANIIPDEAIRFRVIASSNSKEDQNIKLQVRDKVQDKLYNLLKDTKGIDSARDIISSNLDEIDNIVYSTLNNKDYTINFGENYFPKKEYKGITYSEGYYESLVITIGKGEGNNWWCVLFPPLCLLEAEESDEVEYKFLIQELIEKYL